MKTKDLRLGAVLTAALVLTACAGRSPDPVALVQGQDTSASCTAIQAELAANTTKISELGKDQGKKVAQNVAAGVAGLFIPVLWFAMDFQGTAGKEITALEQRNAYLAQTALERCDQITTADRLASLPGVTVVERR